MAENAVRLDKWLWAARFFKTRALAKKAIEGGKVHYQSARSRPSKTVAIGAQLTIRTGWSEKTVVITALSDQRRGAPEAALLYQETTESVAKREQEISQRRLQRAAIPQQPKRPTKKQRRQIIRFKNIHSLTEESNEFP